MKKIFLKMPLICLAAFSFLFTSCGKKKTAVTSENSLQLQLSDSGDSQIFNYPQTHSFTNKKILVLFGYDFNSDEFSQKVISELDNRYGLFNNECESFEDGGIIYALRFPDDFKRGGRSYSTELYNILSDPDFEIGGILLLGAPDYTHLALARNQDDWNQTVPYPVIALFPQDDGLGIESTCDFIVDKSQSTEISGENEETQQENDELAEKSLNLIYSAIEYIKLSDFSLQELNEPKHHVSKLLEGKKFHNYADPETGLKSINHFVVE